MTLIVFMVTFLVFSPDEFVQAPQFSLEHAKNLRFSAPKQGIAYLVEYEKNIDQLKADDLFKAYFVLYNLYIKVGEKEKAEKVLTFLEQRLKDSEEHLPWLALMKVQVLLIN